LRGVCTHNVLHMYYVNYNDCTLESLATILQDKELLLYKLVLQYTDERTDFRQLVLSHEALKYHLRLTNHCEIRLPKSEIYPR